MAEKKKNISREDLKAYLSEKMSKEEMHAFEKRTLDSAFESEAMEGFEGISAEELQHDLSLLDRKLPDKSGRIFWYGPLRVAAVIVLLLSFTLIIYFISSQSTLKTSDLALQQDSKTEELNFQEEMDDMLAMPEDGEDLVKDEISTVEQYPAIAQANQKKLSGPSTKEVGPASIEEQVAEQAIAEGIALADNQPAEIAKEETILNELERRDETAKRSAALRVNGAVATSVPLKKSVRGKVTSSDDGSALPGVNVLIKGSNTGTITDAHGNYQIDIAQADPTLEFSFIGLASKDVKVVDQPELNVQMDSDNMQLSEVVVTGYGYANRETLYPTAELASPVVGKKAFQQYLESSARYPALAAREGISGRVVLEITIEPDGSISNYEIIRSLSKECDEELIRLVKEGPRWRPSSKDNTPYRDKVRIRLKFPPKN